ncbi:MAG: helix-turn-helix domain-containing protein [Halobacteriota archaeon]
MSTSGPRAELAKQIAGEIVMSDDPGATIRKWRGDFDVTQTDLASELGVSSSVVSDYESGRRASPGVDLIERFVQALLAIDDRRGGDRIRQYARILSAGFQSDIVLDIREYSVAVEIDRLYAVIGAEKLVDGDWDRVTGHTVVHSIRAITTLTSEEFFHLYCQSTSRALIFTEISRGESPLVALRVVNPTPNAVVLHGIDREDLWEHAPRLARIDGYSLAVCTTPLEELLEGLATLP